LRPSNKKERPEGLSFFGSANSILDNFSGVCWILLLVFAVLAVIQASRHIKHKAIPILAYFCSLISQFSYAFFLMLTVRDLCLVASEGILGLFGFILMVPFVGISIGVCRLPNIIGFGVTEDQSVLLLDAVATPILVIICCFVFGYWDSAPVVLRCLFGG
jgi:hypothetical protein